VHVAVPVADRADGLTFWFLHSRRSSWPTAHRLVRRGAVSTQRALRGHCHQL